MSRESEKQVLSTTISDVLDSFIGTEGLYFLEIQACPLFSSELKSAYLQKARDEDCHTFLNSLDLLYSEYEFTYEKEQLDFLRALKTINDICHNNEVKLGEHGIHNALEHFFRNYHQPSDIPLIQARAKEIVSEHIEHQKSAAEVTITRTWFRTSLQWRKDLDLPRNQLGIPKSQLNSARFNAMPLIYPTIDLDDSTRFLEQFKNPIKLNNFLDQYKKLNSHKEKVFWLEFINFYSKKDLDHALFIFKKHPFLNEEQKKEILSRNDTSDTHQLIAKEYEHVIKKISLLIAKLDAYLDSIPDISNTSSNFFRNRIRTDSKKQYVEELKKTVEGCILVSDIEKAVANTIAKVNKLEEGVSRRVSSNKCGECLIECQVMLHDKPGKTRTFC